MTMRRRREDGAAAAEFAFVAPLLVILLLGIVHFGLVTYRHQVIESAAREGARVASVGASRAVVEQKTKEAARTFDPDHLTITSATCADVGRGNDVVVNIEVEEGAYDFDIPFLKTFSPEYRAGASYRCEKA